MQYALDDAKSIAKKYLLFGGLNTPLIMKALLPINHLDNDWVMAIKKAKAMGVALARQLLERDSNRPLNLVAYSMGCMVVIALIEELYKENKFGYLQDGMIIQGVYISDSTWLPAYRESRRMDSLPSSCERSFC